MNFTHPARIVRRITPDDEGEYTIVNANEAYFNSELITPELAGTRNNSPSPREQPRYLFRWHATGLLSPIDPTFNPGDRLQVGVEAITYEILSGQRNIGAGVTEAVYEAEVLPVEEIYPFTGILQNMAGVAIVGVAEVRFSAFANSEEHLDQGTYENFEGQAPLDFRSVLKINRQLQTDAFIFRIVSAETDNEGNYVRMTLRRSHG